MARLLLLNGPNLNLLGSREPEHYGSDTLASIEAHAAQIAHELGHELTAFQSNAEHALIDRVHAAARDKVDFLIVNPGGFTHTSVALRDALVAATTLDIFNPVYGATIDDPLDLQALEKAAWTTIVPRSPLEGNQQNVFAVRSLERFTHVKHGKRPVPFTTWQLPFHAIDYCLREAGISMREVDHVAYSFHPEFFAPGSHGEASIELPLRPSASLGLPRN